MRALILAGGLGTRLRPLTNATPKPLVSFMGDPYAFGLLRRLAAAGVERATFLVSRHPEPFQPLLDIAPRLGLTVDLLTEETALDTAGAARRALAARREDRPVLVLNGDVLTDVALPALLARHQAEAATATLHLTRVAETSSLGVVVCDGQDRIQRFVEKPPPGTEAADTINAGTYVLAPDALEAFPGDGPLSFEREVFPGLVGRGARCVGVVSDAYWQDLGTPSRYLEGHRAVLDKACDWPVADGMERRDGPAIVHRSATVAGGAAIEAGAVIGPECTVADGARIAASVLHERVTVGAGSTIEGALIAADVRIGAGVTVPPGSVVGRRTVLGGG